MRRSLVNRLIVYLGIGLVFLLAIHLSEDFRQKEHEGDLPSINIDRSTADYLEKGQWNSALDDLVPLFERKKDPDLKAYIALCFKQLGFDAFLDHRYGEAIELTESGLTYSDADADLYLILGAARLAQTDYDGAEAAFEKVLALNSDNAEAQKQLGEIYYLRNELERAEAAWSEACALDPGDSALEKRLLEVRKLLRLNKTLDTEDNLHFSVTYDGETMPALEHTVLETLESAYYDIGGRLQIYPKRLISVTLLTRQAFFDVTGSPDWTAGLYEGQIKIPMAGADPDRLKRTLYHEYTHAVLFDQLGPRCPWWFNEGLAQYLSSGGIVDDLEAGSSVRKERLRPDGVSLSDLGSVFGLDGEKVSQSYSMALSGMRYFVASFGEPMIQKIIMLMSEGDSFETAFYTATGYPFDQFEEKWRRSD